MLCDRHAGRSKDLLLRGFAILLGDVVQQALVVAPFGLHLHVKLQIHARVEEPLKVHSRGGADALDHLAAPADDDGLLRLPINQDGAVNAERFFGL